MPCQQECAIRSILYCFELVYRANSFSNIDLTGSPPSPFALHTPVISRCWRRPIDIWALVSWSCQNPFSPKVDQHVVHVHPDFILPMPLEMIGMFLEPVKKSIARKDDPFNGPRQFQKRDDCMACRNGTSVKLSGWFFSYEICLRILCKIRLFYVVGVEEQIIVLCGHKIMGYSKPRFCSLLRWGWSYSCSTLTA